MNNLFQTVIIIGAIILCTNINSIHSIINGRNPKLNEVKYIVAIVRNDGKLCSGGIIGDKYVLTAAHCIKVHKNNRLEPLKVVAVTNSSKGYDPKVSIVMWVHRAFLPAAFAEERGSYDIAVLELSGSIQIEKNSHKLQKLELPTPIKSNPLTYPNYVNKKFKGAGFGYRTVKFFSEKNGKLKPKTSDAGKLQVGNALVINTAICKRIYPKFPMKNRMCYVIVEDPQRKTFQGFCFGDSGTPIVVDRNVVIGVHIAHASLSNCNTNGWPQVAIKTTTFLPFIKNAMRYNGTDVPDMKVYSAW